MPEALNENFSVWNPDIIDSKVKLGLLITDIMFYNLRLSEVKWAQIQIVVTQESARFTGRAIQRKNYGAG